MLVVVSDVVGDEAFELALVPGDGAVEEFSSDRSDPTLVGAENSSVWSGLGFRWMRVGIGSAGRVPGIRSTDVRHADFEARRVVFRGTTGRSTATGQPRCCAYSAVGAYGLYRPRSSCGSLCLWRLRRRLRRCGFRASCGMRLPGSLNSEARPCLRS